MDAEWFQISGGTSEPVVGDRQARYEEANCHETVVPQHGVHGYMIDCGNLPGDGDPLGDLLRPIVQVVEMSRPEVLDDERPDPQDRDGVGRVDA